MKRRTPGPANGESGEPRRARRILVPTRKDPASDGEAEKPSVIIAPDMLEAAAASEVDASKRGAAPALGRDPRAWSPSPATDPASPAAPASLAEDKLEEDEPEEDEPEDDEPEEDELEEDEPEEDEPEEDEPEEDEPEEHIRQGAAGRAERGESDLVTSSVDLTHETAPVGEYPRRAEGWVGDPTPTGSRSQVDLDELEDEVEAWRAKTRARSRRLNAMLIGVCAILIVGGFIIGGKRPTNPPQDPAVGSGSPPASSTAGPSGEVGGGALVEAPGPESGATSGPPSEADVQDADKGGVTSGAGSSTGPAAPPAGRGAASAGLQPGGPGVDRPARQPVPAPPPERVPPELEQALERARADLDARRWARAKVGFDKVLETMPNNRRALFGRARVHFQTDRFEAALADLDALLALDPAHPNALIFAARSARALGRREEASALFQRYLDAWPETGRAAEVRRELGEL